MTSFESVRDALFEADRGLTGPGGPFETVQDLVLGERMLVFQDRLGSLREILAAASRFGSRDCLVFDDGRRVTFEELPSQVASVAAYLRDAHGVRKGDRVAICAHNDLGWVLLLWATVSLGAVVVAMNGWWSELEMGNALALTEPTVVFADGKRGARLTRPYVDLDVDLAAMTGRSSDASLPDTPIAEDDPAVLFFTSGTTGRPKAASLSHRALVAFNALQGYIGARVALLRGLEASSARPPTRLAVFPLFHVSGLGSTIASVHTGATTVWPLGRFDAGAVINLTVREGVNVWGGTMAHVTRLLEHPEITRVDPAQLVAIGIGGSATTPQLIRRTEELFPHLAGTFSTGYGSTETGALVSWAPNSLLVEAPDCVGPVMPTVGVRITGDDGRVLDDGEVGDICVRSPLLMDGYFNNDEGNAEVFASDRWFRTGDFGRLEKGVLFLASRRRDLIIRGGENVYPFEVENRLEEHPDIVEAAVVGVDHDVLGQEVKAIVVTAAGATLDADEIRAHCAATLSSYKVPAHVEVRTVRLPRNPAGKVLKQVLVSGDQGTYSDVDPV